MRNVALIIIVAANLAGILPAEDPVADLNGTWILDAKKSQIKQTTPELRKIRITSGIGTVGRPNERDGNSPVAEPLIGQVANLTLKIIQTADSAQILRQFTADGRDQSVAQKFALDGSQCFNPASDGRGDFVSRSTWEKRRLINSGTETITAEGPRTEIYIKEEFSLSKNGKKLTLKTMRTTPRGVTTIKQVFIREDSL
ncbi:MAG: hypothetical protein JXA73_06220 [Acidobacteria bacterium]|nr:hypothetical protein [Acidobacteriota bacterium]